MPELAKSTPLPSSNENMPSPDDTHEPSAVAKRISRLKNASLSAIGKRERLAQPLFWSLFQSEIEEIRKKKSEERLLRKILLGIE